MGKGHGHTAPTAAVRAHPTACTPQLPMVPTAGSLRSPSPRRDRNRTPTPAGPCIHMGTDVLTKGVSEATKGGLHTEGSHKEDSALTQGAGTQEGGSAPTRGACIPQEKSAPTQGTSAPTKGHSLSFLDPHQSQGVWDWTESLMTVPVLWHEPVPGCPLALPAERGCDNSVSLTAAVPRPSPFLPPLPTQGAEQQRPTVRVPAPVGLEPCTPIPSPLLPPRS